MKSEILYENPQAHISLTRPGHWNVSYYERSGRIILEGRVGSGAQGSARVEVGGTSSPDITLQDSVEAIELRISRIQSLYELETVAILQPPMLSQRDGMEVATAIIGLPVAELPEDAAISQVGSREPGIIQTVEIRRMKNNEGCAVTVFLYKGNNAVLNSEAENIVESIRFTCPTK